MEHPAFNDRMGQIACPGARDTPSELITEPGHHASVGKPIIR